MILRLVFGASLLLLVSASADAAMRCGNRLVNDGDRDFSVQQRCGAPFFTDRYFGIDVLDRGGPFERQREVEWTVWYYNFGRNALMQSLLFRDGILQRIGSLGYGVNEIGDSCNAIANYSGMSVGELVARCGEPASRRENRDGVVFRPSPRLESWRDQRREEWIYDFGDSRRLRLLRLENGRVVSHDTIAR